MNQGTVLISELRKTISELKSENQLKSENREVISKNDTILEMEQKIAALEYENEQNQQNLEDSFAEIGARDEKITNLKMQLKVAESRGSSAEGGGNREVESLNKELEKMRTMNIKLRHLVKVKE